VSENKAQVAKFIDNKTLLLGNEGGKFCLYDIEHSSTGCDYSVKTTEHFELEIMRTLKVNAIKLRIFCRVGRGNPLWLPAAPTKPLKFLTMVGFALALPTLQYLLT